MVMDVVGTPGATEDVGDKQSLVLRQLLKTGQRSALKKGKLP